MAELIPYSSATELAQLYHQTIGEVLQLIAAADEKLSTLNDKFGNIGSVRPFDWDFKIHGTDKPDKIRREMKRNAWRVLISKLGVERLMSPKRRESATATKLANEALICARNKIPQVLMADDDMPEQSKQLLQELADWIDTLATTAGDIARKVG